VRLFSLIFTVALKEGGGIFWDSKQKRKGQKEKGKIF
jgi:hypothetical protein